jgi:hypothetical protein
MPVLNRMNTGQQEKNEKNEPEGIYSRQGILFIVPPGISGPLILVY